MHKVVITGANGFIGSNLVKYCLSKSCEVRGLIRQKADVSLLPEDFLPVRVDYANRSVVSESLEGQEILVHNAAITRGKNWKQFEEHNINLTSELVDLANKTGSIKHFVFISSQAAAGVCCGTTGKIEDEECKPVSFYGRSKLLAEEAIKRNSLKPWTIIRPASVFGVGDTDFLQYFKLIRSGFSLVVGRQKRSISLIPVEGLTEMIYRTIDNPKAHNEVFFAAGSQHYCWEDFISAVEEALGKRTTRIRVPVFLAYCIALLGEIKGKITGRPPLLNLQKFKEMTEGSWICDPGKARELLGFDYHFDLTDSLKRTYNWYKEQRWL